MSPCRPAGGIAERLETGNYLRFTHLVNCTPICITDLCDERVSTVGQCRVWSHRHHLRDRLLFARLFGTTNASINFAPSWNVAPTQQAMVIRRHPNSGERQLDLLQWGLVPHFTKELKTARRPINARCETAGSSSMFRGALTDRRCIVPADAFYEWRTMPDGKQPYAVVRWDGAPLAFAGLWESWRDPAGEVIRSFAILTTTTNSTMRTLHDRMPVILEPAAWPVWLGEAPGAADSLMRPASDDVLRLWAVSRAVNSVRNNFPDLLDRIDDPHAPPPSDAPPGDNPA